MRLLIFSVLLFILLVPSIISARQNCIISGNSSCDGCSSYKFGDRFIVCSNNMKDSNILLDIDDNIFDLQLKKGNESTNLILSTVYDNGIMKPKLDVSLVVSKLDKIPSLIDTSISKFPLYSSLFLVILIFLVISLILKDLSSPWKKHYHRRKHFKNKH
ncbi:hypothetical protein J4476_01490 [Candidatus Woesearchaeota archaeon]|nr:MAG: hypothetical protein QT09_C0012G0064 [archaeon GW2011_AR18]MBS3161349.1 hypothetical protein [Candidatus Woesearchaeota archaeon]